MKRWRSSSQPTARCSNRFGTSSRRTRQTVRCSTWSEHAATSKQPTRPCGTSTCAASARVALPLTRLNVSGPPRYLGEPLRTVDHGGEGGIRTHDTRISVILKWEMAGIVKVLEDWKSPKVA